MDRVKHDVTADEAIELHRIVQAVAASVACLGLLEVALLLINQSSLPTSAKIWVVKHADLLLLAAVSLPGLFLRGSGLRAILIAVACAVLIYSLLTQFRGLWIWPGTFDDYDRQGAPWARAIVIGTLASLALGALSKRWSVSEAASWILLAFCAIVTLTSVIVERVWSLDSAFGHTRWLAYGTTTLVLLFGTLCARRLT